MQTMEQWLGDLDAHAATFESPYSVYSAHALILAIWGGKGIPAPEYDPRYSGHLKPFAKAVKKFGKPLIDAINERAKTAWYSEHPDAVVSE